mgnify:CR=1 FL=1
MSARIPLPAADEPGGSQAVKRGAAVALLKEDFAERRVGAGAR